MGDPARLRNKYERPKQLWDTERITEEKGFKNSYGLKNMRELWIALAWLKKYRREARRLLSMGQEERAEPAKKILAKLNRYSILKETSTLDEVLSLTVKDILERRLQTLVVRKGLAKSMVQSRQLITHGFIAVSGKKVSIPSYLVYTADESAISYSKPIDLETKAPVVAETKEEAPVEAAAS
ncbi:MAG: 30S ribosomal protein S4 [Candidatus Micrarchaeota archaeon]|nr:30S ribosomal protein S4 [Candidatus Micrarchaeota archaeon]